MTSKLIVNSIRHTGASADAITMDASGNVTFPANATCSGTASGFGGISSAQQFRLAANQTGTSASDNKLTNWEEVDTDYQAIGSNWSQSSGIFSCSATGIYLCMYTFVVSDLSSSEDAYDPSIQISTDSGGNYTTRAKVWGKVYSSGGGGVQQNSVTQQFMFDVANTSTFRLIYREGIINGLGNIATIGGSSTQTLTNIMFVRLGDT